MGGTSKAPLAWQDEGDDDFKRVSDESIPYMQQASQISNLSDSEANEEEVYNAYNRICDRSKIAKLFETIEISDLIDLVSTHSHNAWLEAQVMAH